MYFLIVMREFSNITHAIDISSQLIFVRVLIYFQKPLAIMVENIKANITAIMISNCDNKMAISYVFYLSVSQDLYNGGLGYIMFAIVYTDRDSEERGSC